MQCEEETKIQQTLSQPDANVTSTLDTILAEVDAWRAQKSKPNEAMPDALLMKIFSLRTKYADARLRAFFGLGHKQYETHYTRLCGKSPEKTKQDNTQPIAFCEVKQSKSEAQQNPKPATRKAETAYQKYGPSLLPATNTIVAEYTRPDGYVLRIHTTDASFRKLLSEFASVELA